MTKSKTTHKAHAFLGAVFVLLIAVFIGCSQTTGGSGGGNTGNSVGGPVTPNPEASFVEGGASLILSPDHLTIKVKAKTSDGFVTIEGCNETNLASGTETTLHAKGTMVVLKGKIIELD